VLYLKEPLALNHGLGLGGGGGWVGGGALIAHGVVFFIFHRVTARGGTLICHNPRKRVSSTLRL